MSDKILEDLLEHIKKYAIEKEIKPEQMISSLTYLIPMIMALAGYEEKIMDGVCDLMKQTFKDFKIGMKEID